MDCTCGLKLFHRGQNAIVSFTVSTMLATITISKFNTFNNNLDILYITQRNGILTHQLDKRAVKGIQRKINLYFCLHIAKLSKIVKLDSFNFDYYEFLHQSPISSGRY